MSESVVENEDDYMNDVSGASDVIAKELSRLSIFIAIGSVALAGICAVGVVALIVFSKG